MKNKVLKILDNHESLTFPNGVGSTFRCINTNSYNDVANDVVKLFTIHHVSRALTAEQIVKELEYCETLEEAIILFKKYT